MLTTVSEAVPALSLHWFNVECLGLLNINESESDFITSGQYQEISECHSTAQRCGVQFIINIISDGKRYAKGGIICLLYKYADTAFWLCI